jgi:hypothetical protein
MGEKGLQACPHIAASPFDLPPDHHFGNLLFGTVSRAMRAPSVSSSRGRQRG